jgi:hypothetical protein
MQTHSMLSSRTKLIVCAMLAIPALAVAIYIWQLFIAPSMTNQPTIVEALKTGTINGARVDISFSRFEPVNAWTFSDSDYTTIRRIKSPQKRAAIMSALKNKSLESPRYHNHPETIRSGVLKLELSDTEWYYVFYKLQVCGPERYADIDALRRCSSNPNSAKNYDNEALYDLLIDEQYSAPAPDEGGE